MSDRRLRGAWIEVLALLITGIVFVVPSVFIVFTAAKERVEASGLEARVIQHEIDHLDGVLMLDRAKRQDRKEALRALREQEQAERAA